MYKMITTKLRQKARSCRPPGDDYRNDLERNAWNKGTLDEVDSPWGERSQREIKQSIFPTARKKYAFSLFFGETFLRDTRDTVAIGLELPEGENYEYYTVAADRGSIANQHRVKTFALFRHSQSRAVFDNYDNS
jgi:hypothetical protein